MPTLDELSLEYTSNASELDLLRLALHDNMQSSKVDTASSSTQSTIKNTKKSRWRVALIVALFAVLVFIVMSIEPASTLLKKVKKGPIRLIIAIVVAGILAWLLALLFAPALQ